MVGAGSSPVDACHLERAQKRRRIQRVDHVERGRVTSRQREQARRFDQDTRELDDQLWPPGQVLHDHERTLERAGGVFARENTWRRDALRRHDLLRAALPSDADGVGIGGIHAQNETSRPSIGCGFELEGIDVGDEATRQRQQRLTVRDVATQESSAEKFEELAREVGQRGH